MKIDSKDISVVVQGAIGDVTQRCLLSIRKVLPKATIILSTWEGTDVSGLEYDEVVFNQDPGSTETYLADYSPKKKNNLNRQIVSTLNGLKKVKTKYALKMRTDFIMKHAGFTDWFDKFPKRTKEFMVFTHKVVSYSGALKDMIFHPCDFMYFGLTEDLLLLFDIPLQNKEDAYYFNSPQIIFGHEYFHSHRFSPEQHIWIECLKKKYPKQMSEVEDLCDMTEENQRNSEMSYLNNFIGIDCQFFGVEPMKKDLLCLNRPVPKRLLSTSEYIELYQKKLDSNYHMPFCVWWAEKYYKIMRGIHEIYIFIAKPLSFPILACLPKEKRKYLRKKLKLKR